MTLLLANKYSHCKTSETLEDAVREAGVDHTKKYVEGMFLNEMVAKVEEYDCLANAGVHEEEEEAEYKMQVKVAMMVRLDGELAADGKEELVYWEYSNSLGD